MSKAWSKISKEDLRFWFLWVVATTVGLTIGMTIRQLLFRLAEGATNPFFVGAVIGISIGLAQLRTINWKWIMATLVGWAIGWPIGWYAGWNVLNGLGVSQVFTVIGVVAGTLAGLLQWFVLRPYSPRAGWWVLASAMAWTVGMAIATSVGGPLGWPLVGVISGTITGLTLLWLL